MSEPGTNGNVSFTVKELLARQDGKLDTILLQLQGKAEQSALDKLDGRVSSLELMQAQTRGTSNYARWVLPLVISLVSVGVGLAIAFR